MDSAIGSQKKDVVVVGAGILGAAIAFHLALRGARVTLVDAGDAGRGATKVSFAWLNAYGKDPYGYHDLNRRSLEMWERFARRLGGDVALTWGGELRWAVTSSGAKALEERAETLQSWGYPTQMIDAGRVSELEPQLNVEGMLAASYSDIDGHVDTQQVVRACLAGLEAQGAEISTRTAVTAFQIDGSIGASAVRAVELDDRTVPCDAVVLAGGADAPRLAQLAGVELPVHHTFGATILTEPIKPLFKTIALLHSARDREPLVNFRQFVDGTVMIQGGASADSQVGDRGQTDSEVDQILADAAAILPALTGVKVKEVQRGRRPIPDDGHPIVGFSDAVNNLYVATTHSGVTLAPLIGELAAVEIVDGVEVELLKPYRLSRFSST
jgi:glycine/D-amino acid oxidase-like deaminating enzyme